MLLALRGVLALTSPGEGGELAAELASANWEAIKNGAEETSDSQKGRDLLAVRLSSYKPQHPPCRSLTLSLPLSLPRAGCSQASKRAP